MSGSFGGDGGKIFGFDLKRRAYVVMIMVMRMRSEDGWN